MTVTTIPSAGIDLTSNFAFTGTVTGTPLGLKEADEWRLTTSFLVASGTDIASNLERNDTASFAQVGTGMSESSGVFTFPSTGIYQISCRGNWLWTQTGVNPHNGLLIRYTTDNSSYSNLAYSYVYIGSSSGDDWFAFTYSTGLFRVANTTTHKVKFMFNLQDQHKYQIVTLRHTMYLGNYEQVLEVPLQQVQLNFKPSDMVLMIIIVRLELLKNIM